MPTATVAGAGKLVPPLAVLPAGERHALTHGWARATARACGVRLTVRGRLPRRRVLLVANHLSWWDILALLAVAPARLVAKHEVGRWPLIGVLARAAGTLFVDRPRPPAGFRPAMFQAAIDAGAPVVPLRIGYRCGATGAPTTAPAFVGDETLLRSVRRARHPGRPRTAPGGLTADQFRSQGLFRLRPAWAQRLRG
ncbi:hypothetical protein GCM10011608_31560 [Micromonospora sonchi]|uniref:Phospholipid/glycerol acyltransferase domain-containing protein n=1 Tax=Micromonospora sonchi TaxID=1763543 RepID=A0A917TZV2_9ACTN|nr:hypothetical protein GCM10011608_31560 [Micromonospora sonchi]